jgi:hypothetical protein
LQDGDKWTGIAMRVVQKCASRESNAGLIEITGGLESQMATMNFTIKPLALLID